ncbi:predicted protein [Coccidioides posadasii str. Silveira]|uniref:Predicted protein n=1 Tax=Coccidioides posadasii (strain RMSCC 757 / Silveira) TaxID=443226 RepID=E9DEI4_COCPS|nr:predicted protein [Coccidioides posadasii str. Silveira]
MTVLLYVREQRTGLPPNQINLRLIGVRIFKKRKLPGRPAKIGRRIRLFCRRCQAVRTCCEVLSVGNWEKSNSSIRLSSEAFECPQSLDQCGFRQLKLRETRRRPREMFCPEDLVSTTKQSSPATSDLITATTVYLSHWREEL